MWEYIFTALLKYEQMSEHIYKSRKILLEEDTLFDWGFEIEGLARHRKHWGYLYEELALQEAKNIVDLICVCLQE